MFHCLAGKDRLIFDLFSSTCSQAWPGRVLETGRRRSAYCTVFVEKDEACLRLKLRYLNMRFHRDAKMFKDELGTSGAPPAR